MPVQLPKRRTFDTDDIPRGTMRGIYQGSYRGESDPGKFLLEEGPIVRYLLPKPSALFRDPASLGPPPAERAGRVIQPGELEALVRAGDFDPIRDLYNDPVMGPVPFERFGHGPPAYRPARLNTTEVERARQLRIANQGLGHRNTRLASLAEGSRSTSKAMRAQLAGVSSDLLGESSPQLGARTSLAGLS